MSGNEDKPTRSDYFESAGASASESGSASESEEEQVEWLVNTREKRATAGNRLHTLLQQEEPDDELELLFAEDEDDAGFSDVEADQSDVQMDSSSDDEDQGPAASDELEGEKELQKAARAEKTKKRKDRMLPKMVRKRVRIDPNLPEPRPPTMKKNKKSERASWLPAIEDAPLRASSRGTTRQSKQELHAQMLDREIKRLKQLANMERAAAAKAAKEKPPLTQEDRLKEAARVEKMNSKSLSRWERAEQEREEERRRKLASLHNRHMEGPVLTWWSGMATYIGGKLRRVGKVEIEDKEKKKKKKPFEKEGSEMGSMRGGNLEAERNSMYSESPVVIPAPIPPPSSSFLAPPAGLPLTAPPLPLTHPFLAAPPSFDGSAPLPGLGYNYAPRPPYYQTSTAHLPHPYPPTASSTADPSASVLQIQSASSPSPSPPPAIEHALYSTLTYRNFSPTAIKAKETQLAILFPAMSGTHPPPIKKPPKSKSSQKTYTCAITGYPAKYQDPSTGLPYCNAYAFKEIQRLKSGDYCWSDLVGAYVGLGTWAARGVPDAFLDALRKPK